MQPTEHQDSSVAAQLADDSGKESSVTANGIRIAVQQHGSEDAPVILLVHGLGVPLSGWPPELVQKLVVRGFRVVMFDNRDIGRSEIMSTLGKRSVAFEYLRSKLGFKVRAPYQLTDMMQDASALLDVLGIQKAHVVGASMGGMIAQLLAAHAPAKVLSLTSIMSTTGKRGLPGPSAEIRNLLLNRPDDDSVEERLQHGMRTWQLISSPRWRRSEKETREFLLRLYARGVTADGIARQIMAIMAAPARNKILASLKVPTLVIHGDSDPLIPVAAGIDTAKAIPGAQLEVIAGMGHDLPVQILERVSNKIAEHAKAAASKQSRAA